jgi:hypothetical protein
MAPSSFPRNTNWLRNAKTHSSSLGTGPREQNVSWMCNRWHIRLQNGHNSPSNIVSFIASTFWSFYLQRLGFLCGLEPRSYPLAND